MSLRHQIKQVEPPKAKAPNRSPEKAPQPKPRRDEKKRGPKPSGKAKELLTLRLKPETIAKFKATGKGWQSRISDILDAAKL